MSVRFLKDYGGRLTLNETYSEGKVAKFTKPAEAELVEKGIAEFVKANDFLQDEPSEPKVKAKPVLKSAPKRKYK